MNKGRLVSRPTEDAALGKCKNLTSKLSREEIINHYRRIYGVKYLDMMPQTARNFIFTTSC